ncbi:hypothetical protein BAUCODRAFT_36424 [Baudoinia panamericana UAMH 10762]|uniref:Uncharacterized protein n=1 Tax=Baudoinia panamericana (strain UAMH 10762) TaxID=717646 RepID=M2N5B5_BAUPA|nr:uncharacterized protein BAUCODRAFT_36424 [Baudoinia panamericana UAMH 10762]EMC93955.1 hypothetical protein BAUCODRAFT_36424 [Baudoinia panamericana UAMH 10762]
MQTPVPDQWQMLDFASNNQGLPGHALIQGRMYASIAAVDHWHYPFVRVEKPKSNERL